MYDAPQFYRWKDPALPPHAPALQVFFLLESDVNTKVTSETGIQTYDSVLTAYVSPINSKSNVAHEIERQLPDGTTVVNHRNAGKYAEQVKLFKAGLGAETQGTPLKDLLTMTPATIMNLRARGIHTIEMMADMPDAAGHDMMGFWELRERAKAHIAKREKEAPMVKLEAMQAAYEAENASLKRQLEELRALVSDEPAKRGPGRPPKIRDEAA